MALTACFASILRNLFRRSRVERDLDEELHGYIEQLAQEKMASGMAPEQAVRAARMETDMEQVKEQVRDVRAGALLEQFAADLRFGARMLVKSRGFTAVAVLTLALGIGANTAMFSVVYGVLLRPLPFPKPDQIVQLWEVSAKGHRMNVADPNFDDIRSQNHSLKGLAEYAWGLETVTGASQPTTTGVAFVSRDFFPVMGFRPILGRGFMPDDQHFGTAPAVLVSYSYWKDYLGGATDLSGLKLKIENYSASVIGVLPPGFRFPGETSIWVPRELEESFPSRTAHNWHVIGRLRDGVPLAQARAELSAIAGGLKQEYGRNIDLTDVAISPLREAVTSDARPALLVLLGAVGFLLLIACANVVNLLLAQAAARERELAIRTALGAERHRLVRQFLTEALLLSILGGTLGVLAALGGVRGLLALAPRNLPRVQDVSLNLPVLLFALGVSVLVAVGLGAITALRATTGEFREALADGSRGQAGSVRSRRLGRSLVSAQLAITLVLLVGAGLLGRSLLRVLSIDPGFRTDHIVTMDIGLRPTREPADKVRTVEFYNELFTRLRNIPGVQEVGGTNDLPLTFNRTNGTYVVMDGENPPARMQDFERLIHDSTRTGDADYCAASEGYFHTLGIPLLRGRFFDDRDTLEAPHVAIISDSLAQQRWPDQDPLGHMIEFGNMDGDLRLLTVVGVVGDIRESSLEKPPAPTIYVNYRQRPQAATRFTVVMRTSTDATPILTAAREIVRALDPEVPPRFNTFSQIFASSLGARRFNLILVGIFAGTALLLAMAGIYGVMAYSVARRTREIGVRMALGASAVNVLRLILGQGLWTAGVGVVIGIAGSFILTRTMQVLLFGVSATDPVTFAGVALLLMTVACLACYLPARRATRVDPMIALRYE